MDRGSWSSPDLASPAALELVIVVGDAITITPLPDRGAVTLGRGDDCEIRIDHRSVSRRHAILHLGAELRIEDLGSHNGTFVPDVGSVSDTLSSRPLRKLSRDIAEIELGQRMNLGSVPILVRLAAEVRRDFASPEQLVVRAPAMQALHDQVARIAQSTISVLILGEAGVGKEVLARAIHDRSSRAAGPFLELDCAAMAPALVEAELFGLDANAITGARPARPGLLEAADGGTIFLDEVDELPLPVQAKLLRVIEDRQMRIGGPEPRQLDLRFIAAAHRDLEAEVARGAFRQDLYFRLNGVSFVVPPLRERVSEIAPLAEQILAAAARSLGRTELLRFSPEALGCLERHAWPGNLRELRSVVERAAVVAEGEVILPADLPGPLSGRATGPMRRLRAGAAAITSESVALQSEAVVERQRIVEALERCEGNQTRAAKLLGMSVRALVNRLAEYNLPPRRR